MSKRAADESTPPLPEDSRPSQKARVHLEPEEAVQVKPEQKSATPGADAPEKEEAKSEDVSSTEASKRLEKDPSSNNVDEDVSNVVKDIQHGERVRSAESEASDTGTELTKPDIKVNEKEATTTQKENVKTVKDLLEDSSAAPTFPKDNQETGASRNSGGESRETMHALLSVGGIPLSSQSHAEVAEEKESSENSTADANDAGAEESITSEDSAQNIKVDGAAKNEVETNGEDETANLSYPKPKNFAERMMNALERGIASDAISWAGGGKAIALKTKHLKNSPELASYFKAKDYSGFIRNCNRWGFHRVAHYAVGPGVVTYENSLFQKDEPHLVKHMRMDSDVQDVFARHQLSSGETKEAEAQITKSRAKNRSSRSRGVVTGDTLAGAVGRAAGMSQTALSNPLSAASSNVPEGRLSKELLLRRILHLTEDFLNHPGTLLTSKDESFRTTMELVRALGQQHQQDLVVSGHLPSLLQLESAVSGLPTAQAQPAYSSGSLTTGPLASGPRAPLQATNLSLLSGHSLLSPTAAPPKDPLQALLQNRLAQDHNQLLIQQQQRQQQLQQQLQRPADGYKEMVEQLLLQNLQKQMQQELQNSATGGEATKPNAGIDPANRTGAEGANAVPPTPATAALLGNSQHEEPQYTSAHELLMRVMNQRKA